MANTKRHSRVLHLSTLISAGACKQETELFRQHFGESVVVTPAKAKKVAQVFNFTWAAQHLLSSSARKQYDEAIAPARKQYNEAIAPAWKQYNEAIAPARKQYNEAIAPAWKQYNEVTASAWKQYNEAIAPAWKQWDEAKASTFAIAYINDKD